MYSFITQKIKNLSNSDISILSHYAGRKPDIEAWGILFDGLPKQFLGDNQAEWAVYTALTLYALHPKNIENISLGKAAALYTNNHKDDELALKRLQIVASTTHSNDEKSRHLKDLIQMLKNDQIGLDYAKLTSDLFYKNSTTLSWAKDYFGGLKYEQ